MLPATVINVQSQASSAAKPADMLLQHPVGPYTTALMTAGLCLEAWQQHILRLAQAVLRLHQLDGVSFERLVASLQVCACPQCPKSCLRLPACLAQCSECLDDAANYDPLHAQEDSSAEAQLQRHLDARLRAELAALALPDAARAAVTILLYTPASSPRCALKHALVLAFLNAVRHMPAASSICLAAPCSCSQHEYQC